MRSGARIVLSLQGSMLVDYEGTSVISGVDIPRIGGYYPRRFFLIWSCLVLGSHLARFWHDDIGLLDLTSSRG
jgi:hypothetical protein